MSTATVAADLPDDQWRPHLRELVTELTAEAALRTPGWQAAFAAVPRHPFVPLIYRRDQRGDLRAIDGHDPAQRETWLTEVYSDDSLITQLAQVRPGYALRPFTVPASSSTRPSLMARMLEDLELADNMRVLEIGTGTGYNAALLSHRLGAQHVHSVDIHPGLTATGSLTSATTHGSAPSMAPPVGPIMLLTTGSSPPVASPPSRSRGLTRSAPAVPSSATCSSVGRAPWSGCTSTPSAAPPGAS